MSSEMYLVNSFQHLIHADFKQTDTSVSTSPVLLRPIRKQQQLTNQNSINQSVKPSIQLVSQLDPNQKKTATKLRSDNLGIDFNAFKENQGGSFKTMCCSFCKNNGEPYHVYSSHTFKDIKDLKVTCPILQQHKCPICGVSGENAHTITYCPQYKTTKRSMILNKQF